MREWTAERYINDCGMIRNDFDRTSHGEGNDKDVFGTFQSINFCLMKAC